MRYPSCRHLCAIRLSLALIGLLSMYAASAQEAWLSRSNEILNAAGQQPRPSWLDGNPTYDARRQALEALQNAAQPLANRPIVPTEKASKQYILYASTALGESGLLRMMAEASGRSDVLIVFRGVKKGQKVQAFMRELYALVKRFDADHAPAVVIDPTRFRNANITSVPTLTVEKQGRILVKVEGVISIDWLQTQWDEKASSPENTLDLGQHGAIWPIAEVDLIDEMQRRIQQIDWAEKKRQALARFWQKKQFLTLPQATEDRERHIDPTVTLPRDVTTPDGQIILKAGYTVNPLSQLPFTQRIVIFDATRPAQIALAQQQGHHNDHKRMVFITTQLHRASAWDDIKRLETTLAAPIYLLTAEIIERFQIERIPAVIEATDRFFVVRELGVKEEGPT